MSKKHKKRERRRNLVDSMRQTKSKNELLQREAEAKKELALKPWTVSDKTKLDFKITAKSRCIKNENNPIINNFKIVAYTSLSPSHHNSESQKVAIESWHKLGIEVYTFNHASEMEVLKKTYPQWVKFIYATKTTKHIFGKPYVIINEMIDHFNERRTGNILMLINSDIILSPPSNLLNKIKCISELGITISSRDDFKEEINSNKKYIFGFDVFFIHTKFIDAFPTAMYSMGQTWWDYWIPYTALKNKIPVFRIEEAFAFHKEHPKQYNDKDWHKMTEYFKFENNITEANNQVVNDGIWNDIINNSIPFNL